MKIKVKISKIENTEKETLNKKELEKFLLVK